MMTVVAKPENICERPTESIPQFTTTLTDNMELFAGLYPIEVTFKSIHPMKEVQILINDKIVSEGKVPTINWLMQILNN